MNYSKATIKRVLMLSHLVFGSFFIPMGFLFAITGALYTFGIKGDFEETKSLIPFSEPATAESIEKLAVDFLVNQDISLPSGTPAFKTTESGWQLDWTGSRTEISIASSSSSTEVKATVRRASPHRFLVQLHKAKGGFAFKLLAGAFGFGLVGLFITGYFLARDHKQMRGIWWGSTFAGLVTFLIACLMS